MSDSTADHLKVIPVLPGFTQYWTIGSGSGYHTGSSASDAVASYTRSSNFRTEIAISLWSLRIPRNLSETHAQHATLTASAFCFLYSVLCTPLSKFLYGVYKLVLVVCATLSSKWIFQCILRTMQDMGYSERVTHRLRGRLKCPIRRENDLPARTFILSTMVVRLCGTGLIEFPPALLLAWSFVDVTWVRALTYEDLGRNNFFFGGKGGGWLEVCISIGVGVAFRKKNS